MTDPVETNDTVSRNRFEAVTVERDKAQAQVEELSTTVKDFGYRDKAREYFVKNDIKNPDQWADNALPVIRGIEYDDIEGILDTKFANLPKIETAAPPKEGDPETDPPAPAEGTRPAVAGPNPAAPGEPVTGQSKLTTDSKEFKEIFQAEGFAGMRRLISEGRLEFHQANQYGKQLTGS